MLFKRAKSCGFCRSMRNFFFPKCGWKRVYLYYKHRIFRKSSSAYSITAGLSSGVAVSFSPILGTHLIQAFILSKIIGGSIPASMVGTIFGNPWSFPFIFASSYFSGKWFIELISFNQICKVLPEHINFSLMLNDPGEFFSYLIENPFSLFTPMLIGSWIMGAVAWIISFIVLYYPVASIRNMYKKNKQRKLR